MQQELKSIQKRLGIAFIYITHDQEEALNMSDRIALMRDGRFVQLGTPHELYEHPRSEFAATFIGQTNLLRGAVDAIAGDRVSLLVGGVSVPARTDELVALGEKMCLCVRAERLHYGAKPSAGMTVPGTLTDLRYAGGGRRAVITLPGGQELVALRSGEETEALAPGDRVFCWWNEQTAALVKSEAEA